MILKLTIFTAAVCSLAAPTLSTPQYQYTYGVPSFSPPAPPPVPVAFRAFQEAAPAFAPAFRAATPQGFAPQGLNPQGVNPQGFAPQGLNLQGFAPQGLNPQGSAPQGFASQDDALELLPPLQHVVGTKYPAVSPGRGFKFPVSQLLNPTPPPNLKH